jgi:hypothetical protein
MDDAQASQTSVQTSQLSEDQTAAQTSDVLASAQSQPCLPAAELLLAISADVSSRLPSKNAVDVHADWLIRVYGPIFTSLPPTPSRGVSELSIVQAGLEKSIATHLKTENERWTGRAWQASTRLRRATARAMEQYREDPNLDWVSVEPRTEMHSFAGSRMTGGSRFQPGFNGGPSYTDYPAAIVYPKYRSLLPEDMKRQMPKEWLEEGSEIASAPPPTEE